MIDKIEKDGRRNNGGPRAGSGRKIKRERLLEKAKEEVKDIASIEFWAMMAKNKAIPRLEGILNSTEAKDETVLAAVKEVLNRALGKSKEFVDLTSMGQQMYQPLTPEQLALLKAKNDKQ